MNIKRFHAPTSREALAKARMAFGDGTLILSNRQTATGVEVMATAEDAVTDLSHGETIDDISSDTGGLASAIAAAVPSKRPARTPTESASPSAINKSAARTPIEADTEQLAMSTLSFQDYVRERMLRRRHEALTESGNKLSLNERISGRDFTPAGDRERDRERERSRPAPAVQRHNPLHAAPQVIPAPVASASVTMSAPARKRVDAPIPTVSGGSTGPNVMSELHAMKELIEERFNTLAWLGQSRQNPIQSNLMLKMIRAGYSPSLARAILERIPEELSAGESVRWLMEVLERNLKTDAAQPAIYEEGGVYAMVGSTGVGKTTTTAKLAALCARIHGPSSVGLITLDTYRIGAHEQLRTYGRMLGIVAHLAHDRAALQDLLGLLSNKKMVLIDTTGVAPRDPRKRDMLDVLDLPNVNRLLVLNAGCHGDTLDEVINGFKTKGAQQAVLSKIDEAPKLAPAIDALIRHQLELRGVTNGQRVPEDWERANAHELVSTSMRSPVKSAFDPKETDLNFFFSNTADHLHERGLINA